LLDIVDSEPSQARTKAAGLACLLGLWETVSNAANDLKIPRASLFRAVAAMRKKLGANETQFTRINKGEK
jgi:hypothetical protein